MSKSRSERIEELKDLIADPETPRYKVDEYEQRIEMLQKLETSK